MAKKGKKDCKNCNTEIGVRTVVCPFCSYHYPTGEIRKDLLKAKKSTEPKVYTSLGQGRKQCPGCNTIIAGIVKVCHQCSFDFVPGIEKKKKDKEDKKKNKLRKKEERIENRRKRIEEKKRKRQESGEKGGEKISPTTAKLLAEVGPYEESHRLTKKEQAERILEYGEKRAKMLLGVHDIQKCWNHVDWDIVREGLVNEEKR